MQGHPQLPAGKGRGLHRPGAPVTSERRGDPGGVTPTSAWLPAWPALHREPQTTRLRPRGWPGASGPRLSPSPRSGRGSPARAAPQGSPGSSAAVETPAGWRAPPARPDPAQPRSAHPPVSAPESTQSSSSPPPAFGSMARVPAALPPGAQPRAALPGLSWPGRLAASRSLGSSNAGRRQPPLAAPSSRARPAPCRSPVLACARGCARCARRSQCACADCPKG